MKFRKKPVVIEAVQAVRDVAKGWVSVPEVEWDSIMKPRNGVETPPAEFEALNNADLTDTELARNATGGEARCPDCLGLGVIHHLCATEPCPKCGAAPGGEVEK